MSRNLLPKAILILVLIVLALAALYPPGKTLKPGIDLAGGTSLIYAINPEGLTAAQERGLAQRMIEVLRKRIDPANIQNLVWRPQGNTRFEIQMPLASKETREKREAYETQLDALLNRNVNPATIMRALQLPGEDRSKELARFAQSDPNRLEILNNLASVFDERQQLQTNRDEATRELADLQTKLTAAGVDMGRVEANRQDWAKLDDEKLQKELTNIFGTQAPLEPLTNYIKTYKNLTAALDALTSETGVNERYENARRQLDKLNMSREQITYVLDLGPKSPDRVQQVAELKNKFPDRAQQIDQLVAAYDEYRPFRGRLDDPMDLRRMLRGAGILEFRILPTRDRPNPGAAEIQRYVEALAEKGPSAASDSKYCWIQIEKPSEWNVLEAVRGQFGGKDYILASGDKQPDEVMLHRAGAKEWKLENAYPTTDQMGRRAIGFTLDIKGGNLFYNVTSKNASRPLAIILDDMAISAPNINPGEPIRQHGIITGTFSPTQVTDMVDKLNAGSLPARLVDQPISERVIGPSIGADNLYRGIRSGLIGLALVMGFMAVYYLASGSIADVALLLNLLFTLAIMAELRATFTLPGIAGFILTIGMSVDANVLIFERIREEQEKGVGLATAIRNGYQRALSAIVDSNLTTILTAGILYYVASEDVKGFAIVLMLGIASSMFTAIFVTRVILDFLVSRRLIKDRLLMLQLVRTPNINWMGLRPVFYTISAILVVGGLTAFLVRGPSKYDIEFTGGTSVQIDLKPGTQFTRQDVQDRIVAIAGKNNDLKSASVYSVGDPSGVGPKGEKIFNQYEITTTATNKLQTTVTPGAGGPWTADTVRAAIRKAEDQSRGDLGQLEITPGAGNSFVVVTNRINPPLAQSVLGKAFPDGQVGEPQVDEVVNNAILQAFQDQLQIQRNLRPKIVATEKITDTVLETYPELANFIGGLKMDVTLGTPATLAEIDQRVKDLRVRPDTQKLTSYTYKVFGPGLKPVEPNQPVTAFTFASVGPDAGLRDLSEDEWTQFVSNEQARVQQATERETSLQRVTQIDPLVGSEAKTRALISVVLALATIVGYIWLRFGNLRFGLAAIAALFHDLSAGLGAIAISVVLAGTLIGQTLLVGDFRISGTIIAAILTLLGYSLNDTIVVFDRIRENRRRAQLTAQSITGSINQTLSRTIITSFTTFVVVLVMYVFGGAGLRGFNYVIGFGLIVGTYSSVAIAAPLLLIGVRAEQENKAKANPVVAKVRGSGKSLGVKGA
jgi:SecD/SecF fusion protein